MDPIVHVLDPDRPFAYGGDGGGDDPVTADILRIARGLARVAECHLFQTLRTESETSSDGVHFHGMTHLLRDGVAEPDAVILVGAYDLLRFVRRMSPDTRLVLWMPQAPGDRWPGPVRIRERFRAEIVARTPEVARALALSEGDPQNVSVIPPGVDGPDEIAAWCRVLGIGPA